MEGRDVWLYEDHTRLFLRRTHVRSITSCFKDQLETAAKFYILVLFNPSDDKVEDLQVQVSGQVAAPRSRFDVLRTATPASNMN